MTMEQILENIKQDHGEAVFGNGSQLLSLFADYSRGQMRPQQNQLDIFIKCEGNTRILKVDSATRQEQQTAYNHLIRKMVEEYGLQEKVAMEICGAFWRGAIGGEPPIASPQPEPKPVHDRSNNDTPVLDQRKQSRFQQHLLNEMGKKEGNAFLSGLAGVPSMALAIIGSAITQADAAYPGLIVSSCYLGLTLWRMKQLWEKGFPFHPVSGFLAWISKIYSIYAWRIHCCLVITGYGIGVLGIVGGINFLEDSASSVLFSFFMLGIGATSVCNTSWHKNKKTRPGNA